MLSQTGRGAGVNVAQQANLQWDALVEDVLSQIAQLHGLPVHNGNVIDQPRPVPNAVRPTILNRLPDRFFSVTFAGVNRDVEVLALDVMKSFHMLLRQPNRSRQRRARENRLQVPPFRARCPYYASRK